VNSFSGGFNTATTLVVYFFNLLSLTDLSASTYASSTNDIIKMLGYIQYETAANNPPKKVGKVLGKIFTKIFNVQVPEVQYKSYGTSV